MKQVHFETKANVKKFATQGSKGGSIVLSLELPLTDENVSLAGTQNQMCVVSLDFARDAVEKADGQKMMDFSEKEEEYEDGYESGEDLEQE